MLKETFKSVVNLLVIDEILIVSPEFLLKNEINV